MVVRRQCAADAARPPDWGPGWTVGQNIRIDYRWGAGNADVMRKHAAELAASSPDVILAHSSAAVAPLLQESRTIPIVFTLVADPVGAGYFSNLARPGGNVTGFTNFEYSIGGKWLELLKAIAPNVKRVAVLRESFVASGPGQFGAIQAASDSLGVEVRPLDLRDADEIERDITAFARDSDSGLIVTGSPAATVHLNLIYALALRHRLSVVYNSRFYVSSGGLISYGPISSINSGVPRRMSIRYSRARALRPCRYRHRSSTNLRSI